MTEKHWQDWVMLALGAWLFISPFALQYGNLTGIAAVNSYVLGTCVMALAGWALYQPRMWEEGVDFALGVWIFLSPFVLGFSADEVARWNHAAVGILIGANATWTWLQYPPMGKAAS